MVSKGHLYVRYSPLDPAKFECALSDNLACGRMQLHESRKRTLQFDRLCCRRQERFIMLFPNASTFRCDQNNPDGQQ